MPATCPAVAAAQEKKGLTYANIAEKTGKTESQVEQILSGSHADAANVKAVADALGLNSLPKDSTHGTA